MKDFGIFRIFREKDFGIFRIFSKKDFGIFGKTVFFGDLPQWVKSLETPDGGAVVSRLVNGDKEYLVVVNRSPEKELTLKIAFAPGAKRVRTDGTIVDAVLYSGEYWLEPGTAEIFQAP